MSGDIANVWSASPSLKQQIDEELVPRGRGVLLIIGTLSKSLRRPLLRRPEVKKPKNDAERMLQNDLAP